MIDLTAQQTQWLLVFFSVVSGLLTAYSLNFANGMNAFRKDKKEIRNKIKDSIEQQKILPILNSVCSLIFSKIGLNDNKEEKLELTIYNKDAWKKLDNEVNNLEQQTNELSEVDRTCDRYLMYTSYFSRILFLLCFTVAMVIPVYIFDVFLAWIVWAIFLTEVMICLSITKWRASNACSKFDTYEDSYVKG